MAKFQIGDKVKLVSDSDKITPMTVAAYFIDTFPDSKIPEIVSGMYPKDIEKMVICVWRDRNGKLHDEKFHEDMLKGL